MCRAAPIPRLSPHALPGHIQWPCSPSHPGSASSSAQPSLEFPVCNPVMEGPAPTSKRGQPHQPGPSPHPDQNPALPVLPYAEATLSVSSVLEVAVPYYAQGCPGLPSPELPTPRLRVSLFETRSNIQEFIHANNDELQDE